MKILFISTSYPPFMDMQTIRNLKLIDSLIKAGHEITVLSPSASWLNYTNNESIDEWRTKPPLFFRLQHFLSKRNIYKLFLKAINVIGNLILFPDIYASWSWIALHTLKDKNINNYDLLITSSGSFTSHIIGHFLTKRNPIKWIADYGDPWCLNKYGKINYLTKIIEKRLLSKCNAICFTTQSTIDAYMKIFKKDKISPNFYLITCGYDDMKLYHEKPHNNNEKFKLTYTGVAFSKDRNLSNAIYATNLNSNNVSLNIVGSYSSKYLKITKTFNEECVFFTGRVNYEESLKLINNADILLHIGNFGSLQIPGKTYIYLATPKPIIYIRQEKDFDPTFELLIKFKGIIFVSNNINEINLAIKHILKDYESYLRLSKDRVNDISLEDFNWDKICIKFNEYINRLVE